MSQRLLFLLLFFTLLHCESPEEEAKRIQLNYERIEWGEDLDDPISNCGEEEITFWDGNIPHRIKADNFEAIISVEHPDRSADLSALMGCCYDLITEACGSTFDYYVQRASCSCSSDLQSKIEAGNFRYLGVHPNAPFDLYFDDKVDAASFQNCAYIEKLPVSTEDEGTGDSIIYRTSVVYPNHTRARLSAAPYARLFFDKAYQIVLDGCQTEEGEGVWEPDVARPFLMKTTTDRPQVESVYPTEKQFINNSQPLIELCFTKSMQSSTVAEAAKLSTQSSVGGQAESIEMTLLEGDANGRDCLGVSDEAHFIYLRPTEHLLPQQAYKLEVTDRALAQSNASIEESYTRIFYTSSLVEPELIAPLDGERVNLSTSNQLTLQWQLVPLAETYVLQIATNSDFSDIVFSQADIENVDSGNVFSYTPEGEFTARTYYWRVRSNLSSLGDLLTEDTNAYCIDNPLDCFWIKGRMEAMDSNVYVDSAATLPNPAGNKTRPFTSIQAALDFAKDNQKSQLIVAAGDYQEKIILQSQINIEGSYTATTDGSDWTLNFDAANPPSHVDVATNDDSSNYTRLTLDTVTPGPVVTATEITGGTKISYMWIEGPNASTSDNVTGVYTSECNSNLAFENSVIKGGNNATGHFAHSYAVHNINSTPSFNNSWLRGGDTTDVNSVGMWNMESAVVVVNNTLQGGNTTVDGKSIGFYSNLGFPISLSNNEIYGGTSENGNSYGIYVESSSIEIKNHSNIEGGGSANGNSYGIYASASNVTIADNDQIAGGAVLTNHHSYAVYMDSCILAKTQKSVLLGGPVVDGKSYGLYENGSGNTLTNNLCLGGNVSGTGESIGAEIVNASGVIWQINNTFGSLNSNIDDTNRYALRLQSSKPKLVNNLFYTNGGNNGNNYGLFEVDNYANPTEMRSNLFVDPDTDTFGYVDYVGGQDQSIQADATLSPYDTDTSDGFCMYTSPWCKLDFAIDNYNTVIEDLANCINATQCNDNQVIDAIGGYTYDTANRYRFDASPAGSLNAGVDFTTYANLTTAEKDVIYGNNYDPDNIFVDPGDSNYNIGVYS